MEYLNKLHPEWPGMWQQLGDDPQNQGDSLCDNEGQCWQYMGSSESHHHFRHNCHPITNRVEYLYVERADPLPGGFVAPPANE